ncbi:MAG: hypothetical protein L0Y73_09705, partial [Candidatus Aminicenantes bacterium]|nr:hypothetical protein [Candidatus Aminicenantes bacterium]
GAPPDENGWPFFRFTVFTKRGEPPQRNIFPNYLDVLIPSIPGMIQSILATTAPDSVMCMFPP